MDFLKMAAPRFNKSSSKHQQPPPSAASASASASDSQEEHIPSTSAQDPHSHSPPDPPLPSNHDDHDDDDDDDDDFITNEVKRRLKELRKNSFMVLIPEEEPTPDDDHPHHSPPTDHVSFPFALDALDALDACLRGFDALYTTYCDRMLFFDRSIAQLLSLPLPHSSTASRKSPRSPSSSIASTLRNLSFKRTRDQPHDPDPTLQPQSTPDPYHTLETAYAAHLSLSWEALHTQYAHLKLNISSSQPQPCISYTRAAQAFQQFLVLLHRFIESEPFQPGSRVDVYTRSRAHLSKLLQVPNFQALDRGNQPRDDESDSLVPATDLIKVLEESILTFWLFLKKDKTKSGAVLGAHSTAGSSLHQVQSSLEKKEMRVKELFKKKKGWKSKAWPGSPEEVELVFALIDIKVVARVLRMAQLSKEQLLWCEEKMSKIDISSESKLRRDASPILFPC